MSEPVTLSEIRAHLGINQVNDTTRDSVITARIVTAREQCEAYTGLALVPKTIVARSDSFYDAIPLIMPVLSITSVQYLDTNGTLQTLDNSKYELASYEGYLLPAYGETWPTVRERPGAVVITYSTGYQLPANVPASIKDAIRFIVGQWENFQTSLEGTGYPPSLPNVAKQLMSSFIDYRFAFSNTKFVHTEI